MYYPSYVYNINENITQLKMKAYEDQQKKIEEKCLEIEPNYWRKNCKERYLIKEKAKEMLGIYGAEI